jgi:hypothetical protein
MIRGLSTRISAMLYGAAALCPPVLPDKGITFRPRGSASIGVRMEILFLISILVFVAIYAAYRE